MDVAHQEREGNKPGAAHHPLLSLTLQLSAHQEWEENKTYIKGRPPPRLGRK